MNKLLVPLNISVQPGADKLALTPAGLTFPKTSVAAGEGAGGECGLDVLVGVGLQALLLPLLDGGAGAVLLLVLPLWLVEMIGGSVIVGCLPTFTPITIPTSRIRKTAIPTLEA